MGSISLQVGQAGDENTITSGLSEGSTAGSFGDKAQELKMIIIMEHIAKKVIIFMKILFIVFSFTLFLVVGLSLSINMDFLLNLTLFRYHINH